MWLGRDSDAIRGLPGYWRVPVQTPVYVPAYATPAAVVPVYVPEFGCVKPFVLNDTLQSVQQFVCVLPFTRPVKHEPITAVPVALVDPGNKSDPVDPDIWKKAVPLGGFPDTCQESSTSVAESLATVMVAVEVLDPESVFGVVF